MTLTEILISIMIMGVGLISLATLFPIGLLRLREASRLSRSTYLTESAGSDMAARNLLTLNSFLPQPLVHPAVHAGAVRPLHPGHAAADDGRLADRRLSGLRPHRQRIVRHAVRAAPGLPVAYDPLWWTMIGQQYGGLRPNYFVNGTTNTGLTEGRFGSGIGLIRNDPEPEPGPGRPTAPCTACRGSRTSRLLLDGAVTDIFVSPEDIVWQGEHSPRSTAAPSSPT